MGMLTRLSDGETVALPAQVLVGRSAAAWLRIRALRVSGEHASLRWTGDGWVVRDLGSRNGTWLNGDRLDRAGSAPIHAGDRLAFGDPELSWQLSSDDEPTAIAHAAGRTVVAQEGMLLLPGADDPEVVVHEDREEGWVAEQGDTWSRVESGSVVQAGGAAWHLWLPDTPAATIDPGAALVSLDDLRFDLRVSRDEEYVEVHLASRGGWAARLEPRSYHYVLLTLARVRLEDTDNAEPERGWVYRDQLARMAGLHPRTLTVHLCRIRRQLQAVGVLGVQALIEQRASTRQIRLATSDVRVGPLESAP